MNKEQILEKISSNYIFQNIFDFIPNKVFKYKLFVHSKFFQEKLNIKLIDYRQVYVNQFGLPDINNYFSSYNYSDYEEYDKNYLNDKLKKDLLNKNTNINKLKEVLIELFNHFVKFDFDYFENREHLIDIYSPFFDTISKTAMYEKIYSIPIPVEIIKKLKLKNDYISSFNKLNESNGKYPSLTVYYKECKDMKLLNELNIDFNKVQRLSLFFVGDNEHINTSILFKDFFSIKNIKNITYLDIDLNANYFPGESFEEINNFESLKILKLNHFIFNKTFLFNLQSVEYLNLSGCENIYFSIDTFLNIKKLYIDTCYQLSSHFPLKMPKIEECKLIDPDFTYSSMLDFSSMENIKDLYCKVYDFILLDNSKIEKVQITSTYSYGSSYSYDIEKKMIEKFISFKNLKKIQCILHYFDDDEILKIEGENESVEEMYINWKNTKKAPIFFNIQKKFPNMKSFIFESDINEDSFDYTNVEIIEKENCKINNICAVIYSNLNLKLNCGLFEDLEQIDFTIEQDLKDIEKIFPIFSDKCPKVFKSLISFKFCIEKKLKNVINMNILKNIYNNLDKMPKLESLDLIFFVEGLEKEFYMKFVDKVFSMRNIVNIGIKLFGKEVMNVLYNYNELKELFHDKKNFKNLRKCTISKFDETLKNIYNED